MRVGNTSSPAGHGAGQLAGYLVVLLSSQELPPAARYEKTAGVSDRFG